MKKITFSIFLFLTVILMTFAQEVQIGSGTNKDQKLPFYPAFYYSFSESIYKASEINGTGQITAIKWYYSGSTKLQNTKELRIFIGHTTKSEFSTNSDWLPITQMTEVYNGTFSITTNPGWKTITLTKPFNYDGFSNIVIATHDNNIGAPAADSFNDRFYNTQVNGNRSLAFWGDTSFSITNPPKAEYTGGFIDYVPNVILVGITQQCANALGLTSSNITTNSATISWEASTPAPSLGTQYYYSTSSTDPNGSTVPKGSVTSGVTANLSPLLPGTKYYVWVRNNCSTDVYSAWSTIASFTTDCEGVDYLFEDFDSEIPNNLPPCWKSILRGPGLANGSTVGTFEVEYNISPKNIAELYMGDSPNTADVILVSPKLSNLGEGTNRLKLYVKGNVKQVEIGTIDTNNNSGVFNVFKTINVTKYFDQYEIDFQQYRGSDRYIGIRTIYFDEATYCFADVDNFLWEANPPCIDVKKPYVTATTSDTATIQWDQVGAPQYQIVYGISNDTFPTDLTPLAPTSGTQEELLDLIPNTTYRVWIRSVCENDQFGVWSDPTDFTTPCIPEPEQGFYQDFNNVTPLDLPNCWSKIITGPTTTPFSTVDTDQYTDILPLPNVAAQLYTFETPSDAYKVMLVTPDLSSTLKLGKYRLKFIAKHREYASSLEIGTLNNNTDFATFNVIQVNNLTSTTKEYTVDFTQYTGSDRFIGIRLKPSQSYTSAIIDNITWELAPSCSDVSDINIVTTTSNSVTVGWTDGGSSESFDVAVIAPNNVDPGSSAFINTTDNPVVIENLNGNTTYSIWVRSVCAGNDLGNWIGPVNFTTACNQVAVFNETFESTSIPKLPSCWSKILRGNTLSTQASVQSSYSYLPTLTKSGLIKNLDSGASDDVILVTPNLSTLTTGAYRLRFKAKGDNVGILEFGTLNSNLNNAIFTSINQTIIPSSTTTEYIIDFNGSYGSDTFVGIRAVSQYTYVELDNIVWEPIPTCPDVKNVVLETATKTAATIYWEAGNATNWEVAVGATSVTDPNSITPIDTNIPAVVLSDLNIGTCYNVWVRSICDVSLGNGKWSNPIEICTQCDATNVPYSQNFETAVLPKMPLCTSAVNLSAGSANWYIENDPGYGFTSNTLTYNSDLYTDANAWFFTQGVNLESGKNYTISYKYGGASTDTEFYNNSLKVMYGKEAAESFMTLPIADYPFFAVDSPVSQSYTISPPSSGVYYFGFNVYSPNNSNYMFIDDIKIDTGLSNNQFNVSSFNYYPNPIKDILNISNFNKITSISVYNLLGQEVSTKSVNNNIAKVDMSALASGTYMIKITSNEVTKTIKVIKQ